MYNLKFLKFKFKQQDRYLLYMINYFTDLKCHYMSYIIPYIPHLHKNIKNTIFHEYYKEKVR